MTHATILLCNSLPFLVDSNVLNHLTHRLHLIHVIDDEFRNPVSIRADTQTDPPIGELPGKKTHWGNDVVDSIFSSIAGTGIADGFIS